LSLVQITVLEKIDLADRKVIALDWYFALFDVRLCWGPFVLLSSKAANARNRLRLPSTGFARIASQIPTFSGKCHFDLILPEKWLASKVRE